MKHDRNTRILYHCALAACVVLAACGGGERKAASQVAAKVNKEEISVHQINFVLQRMPGLAPERAEQTKKEILERLIEQEVLVQAADERKLDRDAEVLQRLEAGRREILARAYLERFALAISKPEAKEVSEFFKAQPRLFESRKVFKFNEIVLPNRPANWPDLEKVLAPVKTIQEAAAVLRERGIDAPIATNSTRGSEQIPLSVLPQFDKLKEGDVVIYAQPPAILISQVVAIRSEPVDEKRAGPVIEQFLINKRRAEVVQSEAKRLRDAAKVTYLGEFERTAAPPAAEVASSPAAPAPAANQGSPSSQDDAITKGVKSLR